jgi:hypothetical protein
VPDQFYDVATGKVNEEKFSEHLNAQAARIAADDSRKLSLPQTAEAYKTELPADFKPPEGVEFTFNQNDPLLAQAKATALELGIPQEGFSKLLSLYAGAQVASATQIQAAKNAEIAKLGAAGPARVTAVTTYLESTLGKTDGAQLASRMFTADDVRIMEKLVARVASQGTAGFDNRHRNVDQPGKVDSATYEKMSYSEKKEYANKFAGTAH